MAIIDFGIKSIGSFLKDKNYFIPSYQREYAWDANDQISDFILPKYRITLSCQMAD
jgi:uncharacterized protein with ParB-like and HNH nuclease domain